MQRYPIVEDVEGLPCSRRYFNVTFKSCGIFADTTLSCSDRCNLTNIDTLICSGYIVAKYIQLPYMFSILPIFYLYFKSGTTSNK